MSGLTAVSLFAGIEGIGLGLERGGVQVKAAVEIDEDCRGVIARHFPQTRLFNDVREVTGDQLRAAGFVPERGIIAAGFPCQDLSIAGRRAGLGGARSGLFWQIMRLADELHPQWLLLENVPGLLSAVCPCPGEGACVANGRAVRCGEWRVEPADDAPDLGPFCPVCGHDWDVHDAGGFCATCSDTCEGLPEVRQRKVWADGVPHSIKGGACPGGCMPGHGGAMGTILGALGHRGYGFAARVLDAQFFGVPQRRERVFIVGCLGDPAGPVEVLLEPESSPGHSPARRTPRQDVAGTIGSRVGGSRTTDLDGHGAYLPVTPLLEVNGRGSQSADDVKTGTGVGHDDDPMFTLQAGKQHGVAVTAATLQGGGRRGHRIDAEGAAGGHLIPVGAGPAPLPSRVVSACETTREGKGADSDCTSGIIAVPVAVRRLTPLECERLQGLPDGWTAGQSDSARYRQIGNSVAVPVIEWIASRVVAVEDASSEHGAVA